MSGKTPLRLFRSDDARARYMATYDTRLASWPVAYEELDLPTRVGTTHAIASGSPDAPALVLLGSMMAGATVWRPNVAALSRSYRTYAVDVIGEPNKSVPTRRIWSRRGFADWFVDLLDALNIERACIVGNSYGGFLAQPGVAHARACPTRRAHQPGRHRGANLVVLRSRAPVYRPH